MTCPCQPSPPSSLRCPQQLMSRQYKRTKRVQELPLERAPGHSASSPPSWVPLPYFSFFSRPHLSPDGTYGIRLAQGALRSFHSVTTYGKPTSCQGVNQTRLPTFKLSKRKFWNKNVGTKETEQRKENVNSCGMEMMGKQQMSSVCLNVFRKKKEGEREDRESRVVIMAATISPRHDCCLQQDTDMMLGT